MSKEIRVYRADEAPATPQAGDLQYDQATARWNEYDGSVWGTVRFVGVNATATTVTALTLDSLTISAGFASTNSTGPAFYIPNVTGAVTGAVASLGGRTPLVYNTTGRAFMVRDAGSWYTTVSLALA